MSELLHHLSIDLETYSTVSIGAAGSYRYILDPSFEILLFAYSLDGMPVEVIDVASGQVIPLWLKNALKNSLYIKHAYNAAFEWFALSKYLGWLPPDQWRDTMLHALYCGYPASLDAAGRAMGLPEDKKKLTTGKALIRYFCVPCKPSNANGNRTRNLPKHDPAKWKLFKEYNGQDVVTEMEIDRRLSAFPVPAFVQKQWETDLTMNARGVAADMEMVSGALVIGATVKSQLMAEARQLSGLDNLSNTTAISVPYQQAIDKAILSVSTGMTDYKSAMRQTIKDIGWAGMQVQYASGYHRRLDTAARQNIIDGACQIAQHSADEIGKALGYDAVELSAHLNSAPDHEPVQGHVFLLAEYAKMQAGMACVDVDGHHFAGFNRPIGEWNCGHFAAPFSTEYSVRKYSDHQLAAWITSNHAGVTIGNKEGLTLYQCSQMMRKIETDTRRWKDVAQLARVLKPYIDKEENRRGAKLVTGGVY